MNYSQGASKDTICTRSQGALETCVEYGSADTFKVDEGFTKASQPWPYRVVSRKFRSVWIYPRACVHPRSPPIFRNAQM